MLPEELTADLRQLAAELDELAGDENLSQQPFPALSDFEPIALLGSGGMGTVYVARQLSLERDVAVKVVSADAGASLPEEARTVAQLHHPNIVQVFSAGLDADSAWFAMELVKGESADRRTFSSAEEVARLGVAVAEALAYAHRCGILHRDVKPSNIFVGDDGMVKLGDFGLACLAAESEKDKSGTKRYMAPEVLDGGKVSEASDQYSLGVTLRELVDAPKKAEAFGGEIRRTPNPKGAQASARVVPNAQVCSSVVGRVVSNAPEPDFAAILSKATAQDPSRRYENVEAMLADLRRFLAHQPVTANPPSVLRRFRLFARRNPFAACGVGTAAVLLVAFVAALVVGYVRTARALAETERARAETEQALAETHREAAKAAESLAVALTGANRANEADPRDAELDRAIKIAEALQERFPDDATIKAAIKRLHYARKRHAEFPRRPRRRPPASR